MKVIACVMVKDEEERILVTLESARPHVDAFVIYDTGSTDGTVAKVKGYCAAQKFPLHLIEGAFVDFSISRNYMLDYAETFTQPGDFLMLLDCNDEVRVAPGVNIKDELAKTPEQVKGVMAYSYWEHSQDQSILSHIKFMFIRVNEKVRYMSTVHEYLVMNGTEFKAYYYINGVSLYQNRAYDDRKTNLRHERDVILLKKEIESGSNKIRAVFYLAKTYISMNQMDNAIPYLKRRAKVSVGDLEECYCSYLYLGTIHMPRDRNKAIKYLYKAFSIMQRVDPLIFLADCYCQKQQFHIAHIYSSMAITMKTPDHAHSYNYKGYKFTNFIIHAIICYNIRDIENGLKALETAESYTDPLNKEDQEKLAMVQQSYAQLPFMNLEAGLLKMNSPNDSAMIEVKKTENIILFACGFYYSKWDGETANAEIGCGGSELVAIKMAEYLAKKNWKVVFCCDCEKEKVFNNVTYIPLKKYISFIEKNIIHTLIVYRIAAMIKYNNVNNVILSIEDVSFVGQLQIKIDRFKRILCKSEWQRLLHETNYPDMTPFLGVLGNGVDLARFNVSTKKERGRIIWTSDPTRGLNNLLRMLPKIAKVMPYVKLHVFIDMVNINYTANTEKVQALYLELKSTKNVVIHPRVSQKQLAIEILKSEFWIYPTEFTETYCISALEMQVGRVHCIYRPLAALETTVADRGWAINAPPTAENDHLYVAAVKNILGGASKLDVAEKWARTQTWDQRGEEMHQLIQTF